MYTVIRGDEYDITVTVVIPQPSESVLISVMAIVDESLAEGRDGDTFTTTAL